MRRNPPEPALRRRGRRRAEPALRRRGRRRARPKGGHGQAARRRRADPLGSAHAGEGAGGGAMDARSLAARSVALASLLCEVERGESGEEERESKQQNELGFRDSQPRRRLLYRPISQLGRRMQTDGADSPGRLSAQAGARARPNSWPRPRLRPGRGGERGKRPRGRGPWAALPFWAERAVQKRMSFFFFFYFQQIFISGK